ncbi:MAG: DNA mismatch repair endonuclease MutL [Desulfovibrionaceae bacterium]|nr:DNA mismatch repair endonuclease MutL [Desulfovibrionaceae bacterium]
MSVRFRPIQLLSVALQNQIAAGEVCERPASAMKELVENSLDAGATQIDVRLDNGGRDCLVVQDDGSGIPKEELALAVTRHATSKITQACDLESIATLGFRGEALASIASVSRFSISSACQGESYRLDVLFGEVGECVPTSLPVGTLVTVRELFGNVPARLKFLKSPSTELKRVEEALFRIALANTSVGFSLKSGGRTLFAFVPEENLKTRLGVMWQSDLVDALLPFELSSEGLRIHGLAAPPSMAQARANHIYLYVNGRPIQDKRLLGAVKEAYKGKQISREYPQCVLFLEIDPHAVDVNVHPAKSEVRFQDEAQVFRLCRTAVLKAFGEEAHCDSSARPMGFWGSLDTMPIFSSKDVTRESCAFDVPWESTEKNAATAPNTSSGQETDVSAGVSADVSFGASNDASGLRGPGAKPHVQAEPSAFGTSTSKPTVGVHVLDHVPGSLRYLGQLARTYLLFENAECALVLFDQHAVHERILYERLKAKTYAGRAQTLMVPFDVAVSREALERFWEVRAICESMGYVLALDGTALHVSAVPPMLGIGEAKAFLQDVLASKMDDCDAIVKLMACRSAIKAGQELSYEEVEILMKDWFETPNRGFCPHGRPTMLIWEQSILEKAFKRK